MNKKELVNQSIEYIMQHLDDDLSLDTLAAQFFVSKFHFSRIFKEETGESVYAFIKRCRVDQSAIDMKLNPERSITDIGLDYGYSSSNYSSLFRKERDVSPAEFRQSIPTESMPVPFDTERVAHFKTAQEYEENIEVQELKDITVLYERYIGDYAGIEQSWYAFLEKYGELTSDGTLLIERFFNDPTITDSSQCIYDLCMTINRECDLSNTMAIGAGKWVVYHYDGEIKDIFETLQGVFAVWMPQSGYTMKQHYGLNIYRHIDRENHRVSMDLCIPV